MAGTALVSPPDKENVPLVSVQTALQFLIIIINDHSFGKDRLLMASDNMAGDPARSLELF